MKELNLVESMVGTEWISLKQERKELFFSLPMMTIGW